MKHKIVGIADLQVHAMRCELVDLLFPLILIDCLLNIYGKSLHCFGKRLNSTRSVALCHHHRHHQLDHLQYFCLSQEQYLWIYAHAAAA